MKKSLRVIALSLLLVSLLALSVAGYAVLKRKSVRG